MASNWKPAYVCDVNLTALFVRELLSLLSTSPGVVNVEPQ